MKFEFNDKEKESIRKAIQSLENESSGEIVPFFTHQSDSYDEAQWMTAGLFGILGVTLVSVLSYFWLLPHGATTFAVSIYLLLTLVIGYLIPVLFPKIKMYLINDQKINDKVLQRASNAFLSEEVFKTVDRTGILIYISALEHKVIVLADSGINAKVDQSEWDYIVGLVVNGIKTRKITQGLVDAIDRCKELLLDNGFIVRDDDTNELSDDIRIGD